MKHVTNGYMRHFQLRTPGLAGNPVIYFAILVAWYILFITVWVFSISQTYTRRSTDVSCSLFGHTHISVVSASENAAQYLPLTCHFAETRQALLECPCSIIIYATLLFHRMIHFRTSDTKQRKAPITFVMSVHSTFPLSVFTPLHLFALIGARLPLDEFIRTLTLGICMEICCQNPNLLQSDKNMVTLHDDVLRFFVAIRALFTSKLV